MFAETKLLPSDPILGLTKLFTDDPREHKIDLGVGVFRTPDNKTPIMDAVKRAENNVLKAQTTKVYAPPQGAAGFPEGIVNLLLGAEHEAVKTGRAVAIQTPGGCGALRLGGELLQRQGAKAVTAGKPTWANHIPLFGAAGLTVHQIPYYDPHAAKVLFDEFIAGAEKLGPKDVLLVHGACHNPTGADLSATQIDRIIETANARGFLVFVDMAYHGFANGLNEDAYIVREMARRLPELLVSYSCSKNFGLYRERTGSLVIIGKTAERTNAVLSHALSTARGIYSMPPAHGGSIVAEILQSKELDKAWRDELSSMREAVKESRRMLVRKGEEMQLPRKLDYIERQNGMFSLLPITDAEVAALREQHGVYAVGSGRINLCGVNTGNVGSLCEALRDVMNAG